MNAKQNPEADIVRDCQLITAGLLADCSDDTLASVEIALGTALLYVRGMRNRAVDVRPRLNLKQRRAYLADVIQRHHLIGDESFERLEALANKLKREGFYSMNTISADIVRRIRDIAEELRGGAQ